MKQKLLKYSSVLLLGFLTTWYVLFLSPLKLPEYVPGTPININGLILGILILLVLIRYQKEVLASKPDTSIFALSVDGFLISLFAEIIFQTIRISLLAATSVDKVKYMIGGMVGVSLFSGMFSFFIAFQLKTRKTGKLILMILGLLLTIGLLQTYWSYLIEILLS